ncbi:MAG: hypothetical protein N2067_02635 [Spirochaetaceae bacterium]|nr:hypothetical protein [Spirochaetaceae bacterium]
MKYIMRVNVRTRSVSMQEATGDQLKWGGRSFIAHTLLREVPPTCEPLGRYNKLIFASGLLADTNLTTTGKISIGGKSPLTGGAKEANTGGYAGKRLARLGLRAVIIEDIPEKKTTDVLVITASGARLDPAPELAGKLVDEAIAQLRQKYGRRVGIFCIGPAGEMKMAAAGIASPDDADEQIRYAARGGLGALMGSKGLKAVIVDDTGATYKPEVYDEAGLRELVRWTVEELAADAKTRNRNLYGTLDILKDTNEFGMLPTRNFSQGSFEGADRLTGPAVRDLILSRGGRTGKPCVPGCTIQCSSVFPDEKGNRIVATMQYESLVLLGPNCGIGDPTDIAELNQLCNQVGVDAMETGVAIGVAMEAGVIPFGDAEGAKDLIRQIGQGTWLGRILGNGAVITGRCLGVRRVPAIKGQAIPAYDPRALKGNGVTYTTSPMGADHTAGNAFETRNTHNPLSPDGQVEISMRLQVRAALLDTLGVCIFIRPPFAKKPEMMAKILQARYGWDLSVQQMNGIGLECIMTERAFNRQAGVSEEFRPIPEFMREEPLPPKNSVFDVPEEKMLHIWEGYVPSADQF